MHDIEVDQQADMLSAQFEERDELRLVNWGNCINRLDLYHRILNQNIHSKAEIDPLAIVVHRKR
jgi:hypothetical protein